MKTRQFAFLGMGAALALASCSNDIPVADDAIYDGPVETNFLSVNIVGQGAAQSEKGTRADYDDGIDAENQVKNIRFYFFDADHKPSQIVGATGGFVSYVDWTAPIGQTGSSDDNISNVVNAKIMISTANDPADRPKSKPTYVVAVVNPTSDVKSAADGKELDDLKALYANYNSHDADNGFLMTNAVYSDKVMVEGQPKDASMCEVDILPYLYTSEDDAKNNPVTIYVERVAAKVSVGTTLTAATGLTGLGANEVAYDTGVTDNDGKKIYVKFLGWNVTAEADQSYLIKNINPSWTNTDIFNTTDIDWNSTGRFRSFWAVNPAGTGVSYGNFSGNGDYASAKAVTTFAGNTSYTYLPENAGKALTGTQAADMACATPSQVIVAAQLLDNTGRPLEIAQYGATFFELNDLLQLYADRSNIYKMSTSSDGTHYEKITAADLTFNTASEVAGATVESGRYYVYPQIAGNEDIYCVGNSEGTQPNAENVKASLKALGHAKVWTQGYTYWYFDIAHLGQGQTGSVGEKGVVRNHWYQATITTLSGLGTPVYRPDEVIYPEKTEEEDSYIGAKINVLSWRLVPQNVSFAW